MSRSILGTLRAVPVINAPLRRLLRSFGKISTNAYSALSPRWRVAGTVDLRFDDIPFRFYSNCDDGIADNFYYEQIYPEERDLRFFIKLATESRVILDIGANTGLFAILAAKASPDAEVFAFEPYEFNMKRLKTNCSLNGLTNAHFFQTAIGSSLEDVEFTVPEPDRIIDVASVSETFAKGVYGDAVAWKKVVVSQLTVDDFKYQFLNQKRIDLMKIDVESFEMEVFRGMSKVLASDGPDILFEAFIDDERKTFFDELTAEHNYNVYIFLKNGLLRLDEFEKNIDGLNFLLSKRVTPKTYTHYSDLSEFVSRGQESSV